MFPKETAGKFHSFLLRVAMVAACAVLSFGAGFAANPGPIALSFYDKWGHFKVEGSFFVHADPAVVWDVLTDYGHIPDFVHSMKVSEPLQRAGNDLVLRQEGEGGFLFFIQRIHLLLSVHEEPKESIVFEDTSHKDFEFYQGSWALTPSTSGNELEVVYTLDAREHFNAPAFLVSGSIQGNVEDLLKSVCREIMARQTFADQKKISRNMLTKSLDKSNAGTARP